MKAPPPPPRPWTEGPAYAWTGDGWGASASLAPGAARAGRLRVLTFNMLFDLYDAPRVRLGERLPAISAMLQAADADLIALQEVTPAVVEALGAWPWVRAGYRMSEGPEALGVRPYGQLWLSRLPVERVARLTLPRSKAATAVRVNVGGVPLQAISVHLSSDLHADGPRIRQEQLRVLLRSVREPFGGVSILAGDFNFGDEESPEALHQSGFVDLWPALRPGDAGLSFDPSRNPLAAGIGPHVTARRLDRVMLRATSGRVRPRSAALVGEGMIPGADPPIQPSDHFGLLVELGMIGG
ncbi:MAG: endonuclease/exonuclease/phosphatase family protein [Deltaproteobacteria bacterium]|nr:endonuclease/exonuclease/phosphatase family protein [Deltaproteobacteria bacterium]